MNNPKTRLPSVNAGELKRKTRTSRSGGLTKLSFLGQTEASPFVKACSHLFVGYPKAGKTELLTKIVSDWSGEGISTSYFTEEHELIWDTRLERSSGDFDGVELVFALGGGYEAILSEISASKADIVIIDTLRVLMMNDENDNSHINKVFTPLMAACRTSSKTLIISHHTRKGGGSGGEAASGGHAFLGLVDIGLELERVGQPDNRRKIKGHGRIFDVQDLLYERSDDGTFLLLGDPGQLKLEHLLEKLKSILTTGFLSTREILDSMPNPRASVDQVTKALTTLAEDGVVERLPAIKEGNRPGVTYKWCLKPQLR